MTAVAAFVAPLVRRVVQAATVGFAVGTISFFALLELPGDQAMRVAAARYGYDLVDAASAAAVRAELGLERPLFPRYVEWLRRLAALDFGRSLVSGETVAAELRHLFSHTLQLAVAAFAIACAVGLPLGWWAGLRPGQLPDRLSLWMAALLRAVPSFALGVMLILLFSVGLGVLPAAGHGGMEHLVLPALTVGLGLAAPLARVAREATAAAVAAPFFQFAQTKGLTDGLALRRHGIPNAAVAVAAFLGVQLAQLLEGVVIVETLFAWPGLGHAMVHAIVARDVPMVQGTALLLGLLFVATNGAIDALCLLVDPRRRRAA